MAAIMKEMDWWQKLRRTWTLVPAVFKLRKSGGGGGAGGSGGDCDGAGGLLKLRDDVQMCGYRDVEVMWNMLSLNQTQKMEAKPPKRGSKQRHILRLFFWTNHSP